MHELAREPFILQNALAQKLRLEKSTVSRIVSALEKREWVARKRDAEDSRVYRLRLTALGSRIAGNLAKSRAEKFKKVLQLLPPDRRASVIDSLAILAEALSAE